MIMRLPNPKILELEKMILPYIRETLLDTDEPFFPVHEIRKMSIKDVLVDNAPKEIISAVEEWKILLKKQDEEDAKYNYIFV